MLFKLERAALVEICDGRYCGEGHRWGHLEVGGCDSSTEGSLVMGCGEKMLFEKCEANEHRSLVTSC